MIKAGSGRVVIAIIIGLLLFTSISSAKSRGTHKTGKGESAHRRSEAVRKTRKERPAVRQSRIARKTTRERQVSRRSRVAHKVTRERATGRHSKLARRTKDRSDAPTPLAQRPKKELPDSRQSNYQIGGTQQAPAETRSASVPPIQKPAELQTASDVENEVIPPAPNVIKRSANAISIPLEVAGLSSANKSDSKLEPKLESKYEEHSIVSSSVSVGSNFGYRRDPFTRRAKFHAGVDLKAHWGDAVGASQTGIVQFAGWYHGYGNLVIVDHGGGVTTHYAHLSSFDVEPGTHVERGTIVGRAGSTGRATSPHLHYEVRIDGNATNPLHPLALDPSSDYFKQARPTVDAGRTATHTSAGSSQDK